MTSTGRITSAAALLAFGLAGCGPSERSPDGFAEADATGAGVEALTYEMASFQSEVRATLEQIRFDVQSLQAEISEDFEERWAELARTTEETQAELLGDLDRLAVASVEEAAEIRRAASERLAELEGEVARSEVETAEDAGRLSEAVSQHVQLLASDLDDLRRVASGPVPGDPTPDLWAAPPLAPETVTELEVRLEQVQVAALTTLEAGEEAFEEAREELGGAVAELTREVRKHWYAVRWQAEAE